MLCFCCCCLPFFLFSFNCNLFEVNGTLGPVGDPFSEVFGVGSVTPEEIQLSVRRDDRLNKYTDNLSYETSLLLEKSKQQQQQQNRKTI